MIICFHISTLGLMPVSFSVKILIFLFEKKGIILSNSIKVEIMIFQYCLIFQCIETKKMYSVYFYRISFLRGSKYSKNWKVVYTSIFCCPDVTAAFLIKQIFYISTGPVHISCKYDFLLELFVNIRFKQKFNN